MHVYFFPLTNEKVKVTQKLLIQGSHLYRANSRGNPPQKKSIFTDIGQKGGWVVYLLLNMLTVERL